MFLVINSRNPDPRRGVNLVPDRPGLTPFPLNPVNPVNPLNPLMNSLRRDFVGRAITLEPVTSQKQPWIQVHPEGAPRVPPGSPPGPPSVPPRSPQGPPSVPQGPHHDAKTGFLRKKKPLRARTHQTGDYNFQKRFFCRKKNPAGTYTPNGGL